MTSEGIRLSDDVLLRPVRLADAAALARAYTRNFAHLEPWEPIRPDDFYTEAGQLKRLRKFDEERAAGRVERWMFDRGDDEVYGSVTLSGIELGIFLNARMGYWVDAALVGRGLATAAVNAVCDHARAVEPPPHRGGDERREHRLAARPGQVRVRGDRPVPRAPVHQRQVVGQQAVLPDPAHGPGSPVTGIRPRRDPG